MGSHVLDRFRRERVPVVAMLRSTSDRSFVGEDAGDCVVEGSVDDPASLASAMDGVTHVVHCAGRTKACRADEFYETNQRGTRNVVDAVNSRNGQVQRLVHVSSLAVTGPGTADNPCNELSATHPVSDYGRSKLAAEVEVRGRCQTDWVIVRPPAVYGPRDRGFLPLFKAVSAHLLPRTNPRQALSLVYVEDLAGALFAVLTSPAASRKTYFAAAPEVVTARQMTDVIARKLGTWTVPVPLPSLALWPLCFAQEAYSRATGRARLLNLQKFAELRAPGWVCDSSLLARELGYRCSTGLETGVQWTLDWYHQNHWL